MNLFHPSRAFAPTPCDVCGSLIATGEEGYAHEDGYLWCAMCHDDRSEAIEDLMRDEREDES